MDFVAAPALSSKEGALSVCQMDGMTLEEARAYAHATKNVVCISKGKTITYLNKKWLDTYGYTEVEWKGFKSKQGLTFKVLQSKQFTNVKELKALNSHAKRRQSFSGMITNVDRSGKPVRCKIKFTPIEQEHFLIENFVKGTAKETLWNLLSALGEEEMASLNALLQKLDTHSSKKSTVLPVEFVREHHVRRCLRFLRADNYDAALAFGRFQAYASLVETYQLKHAKDSFPFHHDENGSMYPCGRDKFGNLVIVMRPCAHVCHNAKESEEALSRAIHTMMLCCDRNLPGRERATVIYDTMGLHKGCFDLTFSAGISKHLGKCFPERIGKIFVVNNGYLASALWSMIQFLVDPETAQKIVLCGVSYAVLEESYFPSDHPYIKYLYKKKEAESANGWLFKRVQSGSKKEPVALPPCDPYVPHWKESVEEDQLDLEDWKKMVATHSKKLSNTTVLNSP
eukprot:g6137.t1